MKKIAILGGGGYVGTVLSHTYLNKGYEVSILDNFVYQNEFALASLIGNDAFSAVRGDMGDSVALKAVAEDADVVVVLAGLVGDPITKKYPELSKKVNEVAIKKCIDYFDDKQISNLIFISTCSNYGLIKDSELADEDFELTPLSLYAKAKVSAEHHVLSKKGQVSYTGTVLRFATAFGLSPRMRFDLTVNEFTRDLFFGRKLEVFDEHTWRPYCHIKDFARLIDLVINAPKEDVHFEVFNAGGDENNFTKKMLVDLIKQKLPNAEVEYREMGSDPRNYRVSFKKVRERLGFEPNYSVEYGIDELLSALGIGLFGDSLSNKERYGNYHIKN